MSSENTEAPAPRQPRNLTRKKLVPVMTQAQLDSFRSGDFKVKKFTCGCHKQACVFVWDLKYDKWVAIWEKSLGGEVIWDGNKFYDRTVHKAHPIHSFWRWKNRVWKGTTTEEMALNRIE